MDVAKISDKTRAAIVSAATYRSRVLGRKRGRRRWTDRGASIPTLVRVLRDLGYAVTVTDTTRTGGRMCEGGRVYVYGPVDYKSKDIVVKDAAGEIVLEGTSDFFVRQDLAELICRTLAWPTVEDSH